MRRIILVCLTLLLVGVMNGVNWKPANSTPPELEDVVSRLNLSDTHQDHGWQVCTIGEMVNIPGIGLRQRIELCHSEGWRINTYCLDPGARVPEIGAFCSRVEPGSSEFWCGVGIQRVYLFSILETPGFQEETYTPTPTNTPTFTPTNTVTQTPTHTPTHTPTNTAIPSLTSQPQIEDSPTPTTTATPQVQETPTLTALPQIEESYTPVFTTTPYRRPRAGGPGNVEVGLGLVMAGMLAAGAGWWILRWGSGKLKV